MPLPSRVGWLPKEWLAVLAVVISISFICSAPLVNVRDSWYQAWRPRLDWFERSKRLSGEEDLDVAHIKLIVFGMGRMGTAAYDAMAEDYPGYSVGVDLDPEKVEHHCKEGRNVIRGDATNPDFWTRVPQLIDGLEWVLLTLPTHKANLIAAMRLEEMGYRGRIAATSKFPDEEAALQEMGVDYTFNIYTEAGVGFANELQDFAKQGKGSLPEAVS